MADVRSSLHIADTGERLEYENELLRQALGVYAFKYGLLDEVRSLLIELYGASAQTYSDDRLTQNLKVR